MFKALLHLAKAAKKQEKGQGLVEYALILVLVAVVVIVILAQLGPGIGNIFSTVNAALQGGTGGDEEELMVTWNPPANYGATTAVANFSLTYAGNPANGANLTCTNGFSPSAVGGGKYDVTGPRGGASTCTATYSGATVSWPISFGA